MQSLWHQETAGTCPRISGRQETDLAIGGGYTGSWLAYWLKDSGLRVTLLERNFPGYSASGRNGGLLLQGPAQLLGDAAHLMGEAEAVDFLHWTRCAFEWVQDLASRHALDYRTTGSLSVAGDPEERPVLDSTVDLMQSAGIPTRLVPRTERLASIQRLGYDWGAYMPDDGMIHPIKLIGALLAEARKEGVSVYPNSEVAHADENGKGVALRGEGLEVVTRSRRLRYQRLHPIVARRMGTPNSTGPGSDAGFGALAPLRSRISGLCRPWVQLLASTPGRSCRGGGLRHLALDEEVGTTLALHDRIQHRLTTWLHALAGNPAPVAHRWAGTMAMTPDQKPYLRQVTQRIWAAIEYNGHGSTVAPSAARMLRDALLDGVPVFAAYNVNRLRGVNHEMD